VNSYLEVLGYYYENPVVILYGGSKQIRLFDGYGDNEFNSEELMKILETPKGAFIMNEYIYIGEFKVVNNDSVPHGRGTLRSPLIWNLDSFAISVVTQMFIDDELADIVPDKKDILIKYVGDWKNGKKHGLGTEWYSDGTWWKAEFFEGDICKHCDQTYFIGTDTSIFFGSFVNGKRSESSLSNFKFGNSLYELREGDCRGDCHFGYGKLKYFHGGLYKGYFNNSERNGYGIYTNSLGKIYGQFKDDRVHGIGIYIHNSGDYYFGEFINGLENGEGTYIFKNGDKYEGKFKDGKKHGKGTLTYNDGKIEVGLWEKGKFIE
jgi:hypothetical protein